MLENTQTLCSMTREQWAYFSRHIICKLFAISHFDREYLLMVHKPSWPWTANISIRRYENSISRSLAIMNLKDSLLKIYINIEENFMENAQVALIQCIIFFHHLYFSLSSLNFGISYCLSYDMSKVSEIIMKII